MSVVNIEKPRHQVASDWGEEFLEQVYWMSQPVREIFLKEALEYALANLSAVDIALVIDPDYLELVVAESKEIYGED